MLVSWHLDAHIYHPNGPVEWQVGWKKMSQAVVLETVCGGQLLAEKFKKWNSNPFWIVSDIESPTVSELSFRSSVNRFDNIDVEKLITIWDPSVAFHENPQLISILYFHSLSLQLMWHVVVGGIHLYWNKLHMGRNGTLWPQNSKMAACYNCSLSLVGSLVRASIAVFS